MSNHTDKELWQIVQEETAKYNLGIASSCEYNLRNFIQKGVSELQIKNFSIGGVDDAKNNLRFFVQEMVSIAQNQNLNELHENTFFDALKKLCPLFPFC